jgi:hypothetical protein
MHHRRCTRNRQGGEGLVPEIREKAQIRKAVQFKGVYGSEEKSEKSGFELNIHRKYRLKHEN